MSDQVETVVEEVVETAVEAVEAPEAPAAEAEVEAPAAEATEEKADDLEIVRKAVDTVAAEAAEVKAANEELVAKAADLENELATKAAELAAKVEAIEELEAKAAAPMISIKSEDPVMDSNVQFKTFLGEGVEGLRAKAADLQISVDAQGGYALPEELRREIIALEHEVSPLRQVVSVASAETTDVKQLVSIGDAASGWVGETTSRPNTNSPELAQRAATFGEVYARPLVYQHMLEDAFFGVEGWVMGEVARQFAEAEGVAFLKGDGTNKPVGILNGLDLSA
jgi:HK97 family phage major capsid protein